MYSKIIESYKNYEYSNVIKHEATTESYSQTNQLQLGDIQLP